MVLLFLSNEMIPALSISTLESGNLPFGKTGIPSDCVPLLNRTK